MPIIGRFSLGGGNPYVADEPEMVRGLGLLFKLPDGEEWRTAMINLARISVKTPQAFYDRLDLRRSPIPKTGKPDPEKMAAFLGESSRNRAGDKDHSKPSARRLASTTAPSTV